MLTANVVCDDNDNNLNGQWRPNLQQQCFLKQHCKLLVNEINNNHILTDGKDPKYNLANYVLKLYNENGTEINDSTGGVISERLDPISSGGYCFQSLEKPDFERFGMIKAYKNSVETKIKELKNSIKEMGENFSNHFLRDNNDEDDNNFLEELKKKIMEKRTKYMQLVEKFKEIESFEEGHEKTAGFPRNSKITKESANGHRRTHQYDPEQILGRRVAHVIDDLLESAPETLAGKLLIFHLHTRMDMCVCCLAFMSDLLKKKNESLKKYSCKFRILVSSRVDYGIKFMVELGLLGASMKHIGYGHGGWDINSICDVGETYVLQFPVNLEFWYPSQENVDSGAK